MNLRDLQYLLAVVKHRNISKAAEACFVTQPTLSMQLKKLEQELGITLFERGKKTLHLTREAEQIIVHAKIVDEEVRKIKNIALQTKDPTAGELHIGVIPTLGPYLLPQLVPQLRKSLPKMTFWWYEKQTQLLLNDLDEGRCDAALLALPILDKALEAKAIFDEPFLLAVAKHDTLARQKNLQTKDLKDKTLLLLEEGHCLRDQALSICHQADLPVADQYRATSLETLRAMVESGVGISFFPKLAAIATKNIVYVPLAKGHQAQRTIALVYKKNAAQLARLEKFYEVLKSSNFFA